MNYKHFTEKELACKCGKCDLQMKPSFMIKLEALRDTCDFPFIVTSAARCPEYNKKIGGAKNSQHIYGNAVDILIRDERAYKIISLARRAGLNGIGISQMGAQRFIHLDGRENFALWSY